MLDGLLLVDKPKGMSSYDVVKKIRETSGIKKVGHTGTLDLSASGLVLICIGKATKLTPFLQDLDKTYRGRMIFGVTTNSLDEEGEVLEEKDASSLNRVDVEKLFSQFKGEISQVPPMFSALHWKGNRLYKLARKGIEIKLPPRKIQVYKFKLLNFISKHHPQAEFEVTCSRGTYIRSLCSDIGKASGYGAYQSSLHRIKIGAFHLNNAKRLEDLEKEIREGKVERILLPLASALPYFPIVKVKRGVEKIIREGRSLYLTHIDCPPPALEKGDKVRLCRENGQLLAIATSLQNSSHFCKYKMGFKYLRVLI
ncbi:MAG: tRNA pseudouridine(55) synthase TruB [Candidatus Aerophobetes bacterium]|nr:tRNA pseudouridine(55) synthase TruB [Candidatus Aerophobetes bacterium]